MNTIKTHWFLWWGWEPDKIIKWLEEKEAQGWHLFQVSVAGILFKFKKGESRKVSYGVDYQVNADDEYLSIFEDDKWEMVWSGAGGWYIWRKEYEDKRPEIFTDTDSLIQRNNRLIKLLTPVFALILVIFIGPVLIGRHGDSVLVWTYVALITLYGFFFYKLYSYNRRLKNEIKE